MPRHLAFLLLLVATALGAEEAVTLQRIELKDGRVLEGRLTEADSPNYRTIHLYYKGREQASIRVHKDDIVAHSGAVMAPADGAEAPAPTAAHTDRRATAALPAGCDTAQHRRILAIAARRHDTQAEMAKLEAELVKQQQELDALLEEANALAAWSYTNDLEARLLDPFTQDEIAALDYSKARQVAAIRALGPVNRQLRQLQSVRNNPERDRLVHGHLVTKAWENLRPHSNLLQEARGIELDWWLTSSQLQRLVE